MTAKHRKLYSNPHFSNAQCLFRLMPSSPPTPRSLRLSHSYHLAIQHLLQQFEHDSMGRFTHFFRSVPPTFNSSYLSLCGRTVFVCILLIPPSIDIFSRLFCTLYLQFKENYFFSFSLFYISVIFAMALINLISSNVHRVHRSPFNVLIFEELPNDKDDEIELS